MRELELITTFALVSLIWVMQLLHYPFFSYVGEEAFTRAMLDHQRRISWIVVPLMLVELALSIHGLITGSPCAQLCLALVTLIWISTAVVQVKLHRELTERKDPEVISRLVRSNWVRTVVWTMKGFILYLWT